MAKAKKPAVAASSAADDKPATLKELLNPAVVEKLKAASDAMKAEEQQRKEEKRKQEEVARKAEQKRLDNDFGHLLNNSKLDWHKYK
ncbi:MAG: hypothetical protein K0Q59_6061 [Paenibacillus sp.]|jgi:hypothetical protein|nr:hypothetical protein [Paenibacillus sp.]